MKDHTIKNHSPLTKDPVAHKQEVASETIQYTQEQTQEHLNSWKRTQADFENYRKDEVKRMAEVVSFASERMILEIADVMDNLDMAFKHAPPDTNAEWLKGAQHVFKQWQAFLEKYGVQRIAVEKTFNPHKHEAVSGQGETITEEIRAGYEMNGKVIRPARVKLN